MRWPLSKLRRRRAAPVVRLPGALIIGAQKSGTSALAAYLAQHPRLLHSNYKELEFFGSDLRYGYGLQWYAGQWPEGNADQLRFEASPQYLASEPAVERIRRCLPGVRLVAILRDPVERAYSAWRMYRRFIADDPQFFDRLQATYYTPEEGERVVRREPEEFEDFCLAIHREAACLRRGLRMQSSILEYGNYGPQLSRYVARFAADQLLILDAGDLRFRRARTLNRILSHLGLPACDWSHANLADVFVGKREGPMPAKASNFLREYYRPSNAIVARLMQKPPAWAIEPGAQRRRAA
jgi:hypothetical protein